MLESIPQERTRVLVLIRTVPCARELWPIAEALRDSGRYQCTILIGREVLAWEKIASNIIRQYAAAGFRVIDPSGKTLPSPETDPQAPKQKLHGWLGRFADSKVGRLFGIGFARDFRSTVRRLKMDQAAAKFLLVQESPELLLMQEDDNLYLEAILTRIARDAHIPTLMVPSVDNGQAPEARMQTYWVIGRAASVNTRRFLNRIISTLFPRTVRMWEGRTMVRYPAPEALAIWWCGFMSEDPWVPHRWVAKRAVLCRRAEEDIKKHQGFSSEQLVLTGQAAMDRAYEVMQSADRHKQKIFASLGLREDRKTVLFSVPPLVSHRLLSASQQLEFTEQTLQILSDQPGTQTVLTLFRGADPADYAVLAARYNAVVANSTDAKELVALCDLFICVRSSIIWTAIACRKPTLALDFWFEGRVNFYECPGVLVLKRREELTPILHRLLTDKEFYSLLVGQMKSAAPTWATCFDGRATERTVDLIGQTVDAARKGRL